MNNYKSVVALYFVFILGLLSPYISGEVIVPYLQEIDIGAAAKINVHQKRYENRKFSDYVIQYIPQITENIMAKRSGFLPLWTDNNELGRPMFHLSGFSQAYFPSWFIGIFTHNPWRFITILSLFTCFFTGIFTIFFCREVGIKPLAGLIAGTSLGTSPLFMYWLTFPMFMAGWCWSMGALWGITRLARRPDLLGWGALAFSSYSLLMTAYPQAIVHQSYLLVGYSFYLVYCKYLSSPIKIFSFLVIIMSALIFGVILALPVYADLATIFSESARRAPDISFFTSVFPKLSSISEVVRFFVLGMVQRFLETQLNQTSDFRTTV